MTKKTLAAVTFLIPTYKGADLLAKNLASVMSQARNGDVILISEDAVADTTVRDYLCQEFDLQKQNLSVNKLAMEGELWQQEILGGKDKKQKILLQLFCRRINGRFARNVNDAVKLVTTPYFFLLNNDVVLKPGARDNLLQMIQSEAKVFAVTAREIDVNNDNRESGRNKLWWDKGRFWHSCDENLQKSGATAWACGGSSLYDTAIWHELGGFDTRYYPAYWEDIDLSFQAKKHGYKVFYCAQAVVLHAHETTNSTVFGQQEMVNMSWCNGTRFAWKNSNWWQKLQFLCFYPWWQTKQFPALRWWWLVLLIALVIRVALLVVPNGLAVDEAALAYNGFAIWTQRRDEWLNFLPVSFRSFGDYKAPLAIYVVGAFVRYLGSEVWAVRLPFLLIGLGSIWLMMKLVDLWLVKKKPNHLIYGAFAGLLLAVSPWHWHFSHLAFENNYALFFQLLGGYLLLKNYQRERDWRGVPWAKKWWSWEIVGASLAWVLALYSYHSSKVTIPLLLLLVISVGKKFWQRWRLLIAPTLIAIVLLLPLAKDSFWGAGLTRAGSSFWFDHELSLGQKMQQWGQAWCAYLTPSYLWQGKQMTASVYGEEGFVNVRHGDGRSGILTYVQVLLCVLLLLTVICKPVFRRDYGRECLLAMMVMLIGVVPATLTMQLPHNNQAFLSIVGWVMLSVLGLIAWRYWWRQHLEYYTSAVVMLLIVMGLNFGLNWHHYGRVFTNVTMIRDYQRLFVQQQESTDYELRQVADYLFARNLLTALKMAATQKLPVTLASGMEHQYLYALLAERIKPISYQGGKLSEKYLLLDKADKSEFVKKNRLLIYAPRLIVSDEPIDKFCEKQFIFTDSVGEVNLAMCWTLTEETDE